MADKDLNSPMTTHLGGGKRTGESSGGTFDKNTTPVVGKPRDRGKGSAPEKFFESLTGTPGVLDTPAGTTLPNPRKIKGK